MVKRTRKDTSAKKRVATKRKVATSKRQSKKVSSVGEWMGLAYESGCELAALQFFFTLKKHGFVTKVERSPSWLITEPLMNSYVEQLKRSSKTVQQMLMEGQSYTADFVVYFTEKAIDKFIWVLGSGTKWHKNLFISQQTPEGLKVHFEVKPDFSRNSTTPKAVNSMKCVFYRHGIFINLFRPDRVFGGLFVPDEYTLTPTGAKRKLRFQARSINQYLNTLKQK